MEPSRETEKWYDTSDAREWYRQYSVQPVSDRTPVKQPRKKHNAMKVTMIVLCVLILIAATAMVFSPRESALPETGSDPGSASGNLPDPQEGTEGYDDFKEFFDNYFTDSSIKESNIPRYTGGKAGIMELSSCEGLQRLELGEIYGRCIDSIVGIKAMSGSSAGYYWGTGIVMTPDGYILTNAHVISGTDTASVILNDGSEYEALLVGEDTQSDIAVLKIDAVGLKSASFGISDELQVGDEVAAIGNPLGAELSGTMTNGIVSAINRDILTDGHVMTLIQTNAALNEGNSGGPLFNMYGQVIGITNMKMAADYTAVTIEGIGFAIPTSSAKNIVDQLIKDGKVSGRPGIGITVGSIPSDAAQRWDLPYGLYITAVQENSDAYLKGIRPGDVLTAVNGTAVYYTDDVNLIKDGYKVGDSIILTIFRDGETFDAEVLLVDMNEIY